MRGFYTKLIQVLESAEIKNVFGNNNVSPVKYIDLYAGQEQFEENFELFAQNAVLVEWSVDYGGDVPIATITLYCCFEQLRDTSNISSNTELGLNFLNYIDAVDYAAKTIETETTGKLELVSEGFHKMDSIVDVYLLTYECSYSGRKNPLEANQEGSYDTLNLSGTLDYSLD